MSKKHKLMKILHIITWVLLSAIFVLGIVYYFTGSLEMSPTPEQQGKAKIVAIVMMVVPMAVGLLIKFKHSATRKSLDIYEQFYKKELGDAFMNRPFQRKKLLCACRLYDESNYRKALKYLSQLFHTAESYEDVVPVLLFIALCYADAGVNGEAIRTYNALLEIAPRHAQAHSNLGILLAEEGDFESAIQHYNQSIENKTDNYSAYINRANCYFRKAEYEKALDDAKTALTYKNNGVEAASLLTIIYALQGDEENKKHYYHISIAAGRKPQELNDAIEYYISEQNIPLREEE